MCLFEMNKKIELTIQCFKSMEKFDKLELKMKSNVKNQNISNSVGILGLGQLG